MKKILAFTIIILLTGLVYSQEHEKYYMKGVQLGIKGEFQQARYYFDQSLQANSLYIKAKRALDLLDDLDGMMITPDAAILQFKAIPLQDKFKWSEALPLIRKVLVLAPEYYYAHHNLGNALDGIGKVKDAIEALKTAISYNPQYPYTYNNLGLAYNRLEMYDRSVKSYLKAIELYPNYHKAYYNLSVTYRDMGDVEKSYEYNKMALEINPDYSLGFQSFMYKRDQFLRQNRKRMQELDGKDPLELVEMLKEARTLDRILVAMVLEKKNSPQLQGALEYLMEDNSSLVRSFAVNLLANAGNKSHIPLLKEMLKDPDWTVRMEVVRTLAILGRESVVELLIKSLRDRDYHVVGDAAFMLGYIGDPSAVPPLIEVLDHQHHYVREYVARSLGEIGDKRAVKALIERLNDHHSDVRDDVLDALKELTSQDFGEDPGQWKKWLEGQGAE